MRRGTQVIALWRRLLLWCLAVTVCASGSVATCATPGECRPSMWGCYRAVVAQRITYWAPSLKLNDGALA